MRYGYWLGVFGIMSLSWVLSDISHLAPFNALLSAEDKSFIATYSYKIGQTGFFSYALSIHPDFILHKAGHVTLFGLLGAAAYKATGRPWFAVAISVLAAVIDEAHQAFVPGRSSRFGDILLDALSAAAAVLIMKKAAKKRERRYK